MGHGFLKVRKIGQEIGEASTHGNRFDDHAHGDSHTADAGLPTHDFRGNCDAR
jgi:hypothetical protein